MYRSAWNMIVMALVLVFMGGQAEGQSAAARCSSTCDQTNLSCVNRCSIPSSCLSACAGPAPQTTGPCAQHCECVIGCTNALMHCSAQCMGLPNY